MSKEFKLIEKVIDGENISPVLPEHIKNYLIDIDGTICDDIPNEEPERMAFAKVYPEALETLKKAEESTTVYSKSYGHIQNSKGNVFCRKCFEIG